MPERKPLVTGLRMSRMRERQSAAADASQNHRCPHNRQSRGHDGFSFKHQLSTLTEYLLFRRKPRRPFGLLHDLWPIMNLTLSNFAFPIFPKNLIYGIRASCKNILDRTSFYFGFRLVEPTARRDARAFFGESCMRCLSIPRGTTLKNRACAKTD